ncbi:MAG: glycosyltransferase [Bacteroidetes bacterium]|nr:glycosyltransferase [Bacteroidota bacterium]
MCILALVHSYLFYPFTLYLLARGKKASNLFFNKSDELPFVSVIMSLYNEEKVIRQKMEALLHLKYPKDKLAFFIGSDASTDATNAIMEAYAIEDARIHFFPFENRRGKPGVINNLVQHTKEFLSSGSKHLFLMTDANVILNQDTLFNLVRHFKKEKIAIVDANMINVGMKDQGISRSESTYISGEMKLKYREGLVWGKMLGPFGGCYVLRSDYFEEVPPTFLVDDFYIAMKVFEKGGLAVNDLEAVCYEGVSHEMREEYKRKSRISAGNFQNLITFKHLWWPPFKTLNYAFFSHKVLRWFGPFFIFFAIISSALLALSGNIIYLSLFLLLVIFTALIPLCDFILQKVNIHVLPFRNIAYFMYMNVALLEGFLKFYKGIKSNVWEPPKR